MENPFNYLQFATGDRFYDREEIRRDLRSRLLSGQTNVMSDEDAAINDVILAVDAANLLTQAN